MQSKHRSASYIVLRSQNSNGAIQPRYQDCPSDRHSANNIADQLLSVSVLGKPISTAWSHTRLVCRKNTRCISSKDAGCPWQMQYDNVEGIPMLATVLQTPLIVDSALNRGFPPSRISLPASPFHMIAQHQPYALITHIIKGLRSLRCSARCHSDGLGSYWTAHQQPPQASAFPYRPSHYI